MRNQGQLFIALGLVIVGVLFLIGNLFRVDTSAWFWPVAFILLGVLLIARPRLAPAGTAVEMKLLGDIRYRGAWQVANEEIWTGLGNVELDFSDAQIPPGEMRIRAYGFIGDARIRVPAPASGAGVAVSATALIGSSHINGQKRDHFVTPVQWASPGFEAAERKVFVEIMYFISDLKIV
jgi:predicted membrane protein